MTNTRGGLTSIIFFIVMVAQAQGQKRYQEWWFWPDYTLDRNAKNVIGPRIAPPASSVAPIKSGAFPFIFFGQEPTERLEDFYAADKVPTEAFTLEMWLLYHVNQEVGLFTAFREKHKEVDPAWLVGLFGKELLFSFQSEGEDFSQVMTHALQERGWKSWLLHLTATYDGSAIKLYVNGELKNEMKVGALKKYSTPTMQLETAAYMRDEPYMQLGDLLKYMRLYEEALSAKEVKANYQAFQQITEEGKHYPDLFHYTAGPYLQMVSDDQIGIVWETSEPANTVIEYGTSLPLSESVSLKTMELNMESRIFEGSLINKHLLTGLNPDLNQLTSRIPVFPVAGNGEGDLYWFNKYHILPYKDKGYYTFSYGNADFFMLDSNQKDAFAAGGEQYVWLEEQLQKSTAQWKFVAHHHAPYSSDENDYKDTWKEEGDYGDLKVRKMVPLYEKYGVDVVFFGHLHTYQRTHKIQDSKISKTKGVTYIQAGGAGGNLEDFAPTRAWFSAKTFRGHHYLTVEVFGDELELRMYDSEGRMKDIFALRKSETAND